MLLMCRNILNMFNLLIFKLLYCFFLVQPWGMQGQRGCPNSAHVENLLQRAEMPRFGNYGKEMFLEMFLNI